jgi:hypothetical protein
MRSALPCLVSALIGAFGACPCTAQTRVTSLEELRRELAAGDFITVDPTGGQPVAGRLMRLGDLDLEVRPADKRRPRQGAPQTVTIPLAAVRSLERPPDSTRNGAAIGAGVGAGFAGAMFVSAIVVDRNEMDEWAPLYAGVGAVCTGIGALVGWAVDAAHSKPHIRFDASSERTTTVTIRPIYSRGRGVALHVSVSR